VTCKETNELQVTSHHAAVIALKFFQEMKYFFPECYTTLLHPCTARPRNFGVVEEFTPVSLKFFEKYSKQRVCQYSGKNTVYSFNYHGYLMFKIYNFALQN